LYHSLMNLRPHYCVYLARCRDGSLYTGYCKDLKARLEQHNLGKGAKYTRSRLPISIVHAEAFETRSLAMKREAQIKSWSRFQKEQLLCIFPPNKLKS